VTLRRRIKTHIIRYHTRNRMQTPHIRETTFCKLDLLSSLGERRETSTLGPLERANLNNCDVLTIFRILYFLLDRFPASNLKSRCVLYAQQMYLGCRCDCSYYYHGLKCTRTRMVSFMPRSQSKSPLYLIVKGLDGLQIRYGNCRKVKVFLWCRELKPASQKFYPVS
jgi:hypothetical protein